MSRPRPLHLPGLALVVALCHTACTSSPPPSMSSCEICPAEHYCCEQRKACEPVAYRCAEAPKCSPGYEIDYGLGPFMDSDTCETLAVECGCKKRPPVEPGFVGKYASLTATNTHLVASAYDQTYGDLVLLRANVANLDQVSVELVDGAPAEPIFGDPDGYRGGVRANGENVGSGSSLKVAANGDLFIAYHAKTERSLRFAHREQDGDWQTHVVAAPETETVTVLARHQSLQLVDGKPSVVYLAERLRQANGSMRSELRWAWAKKSTPTKSDDWVTSIIDSAPMPCINLCADGEACVAQPDLSSRCQSKSNDCPEACLEDFACIAGACEPILDGGAVGFPEALGQWPAQHLVGDSIVVVYFDGHRGELRAARLAAVDRSTWQTRAVAKRAGKRVGLHPSTTRDTMGIHIAYQNITNHSLHYVVINPATLVALPEEVIDDGVRPDGRHLVGADSAIALDDAGKPWVVYQDQHSIDLLVATRTGNTWTPLDVDDPNMGRLLRGGKPGYGFSSRLVMTMGKVYGISAYHDLSLENGGSFEFFVLPAGGK